MLLSFCKQSSGVRDAVTARALELRMPERLPRMRSAVPRHAQIRADHLSRDAPRSAAVEANAHNARSTKQHPSLAP